MAQATVPGIGRSTRTTMGCCMCMCLCPQA